MGAIRKGNEEIVWEGEWRSLLQVLVDCHLLINDDKERTFQNYPGDLHLKTKLHVISLTFFS